MDNYDKILVENLELKEKNYKLEKEILNKKSTTISNSPSLISKLEVNSGVINSNNNNELNLKLKQLIVKNK